jgi:exopolysaccharide biosynthesis WecB/TagA/CpsF family protein
LGVEIDRLRGDEVIREVRERVARRERLTVMYANAHTLNIAAADERLRSVLNESDLVLNDGSGVGMAARLRGLPFHENLNGSDFNLRLLRTAAAEGWRVFLLGGRPGVAEWAAASIRAELPSLDVAGARHGFARDPAGDAAAVRASGADILLVALGNPRQELWLADRFAESGALLGVGVGAFLDFQAGVVPRAPRWMNRLGIEWTHRLAREPGRLWRRYLLGNPLFLYRVLSELTSRRRDSGLTVRHFGPDPAHVGGMSSVLRVVAEHRVGGEACEVHPTWRPGSQLANARLTLTSAAKLLRMPRDDVAQFHLSERGSFVREGALVALARRSGLTTVVTLHGADLVPFAAEHPRLVSAVLGQAHLVTCLDEEARETARAMAPRARVEILPNPVPIDRDSGGADRTEERVLFAGEIGHRKGADVLVRAWQLVAERRERARCIMVGPTKDLAIPATERLEVRGSVGPEEMRRLLRSSRVVALPSRAERLPMILTEAMGGGRPFVSTPVGGIPALAREGGLLVDVDDVDGLATRLTELLGDPALALRIGERGRRFCEETHSVEAVDARLRQLYANVTPTARR